MTGSGSDAKHLTTRRIENGDHGLIAAWILQGAESDALSPPELKSASLGGLLKNLGDPNLYMPPKVAVSPTIDAAIRSAATRRTFFITEKGYIGLGPTKTRPGDSVFILLGGQTPFILRPSGFHMIRTRDSINLDGQLRFEMIGDCYTHGLMDGEAMQEWKNRAEIAVSDPILQELLVRRQTAVGKWQKLRIDLCDWERETDEALIFTKLWDGKISTRDMLQRALQGITEPSGNPKAEERRAKACSSDLSKWREEVLFGRRYNVRRGRNVRRGMNVWRGRIGYLSELMRAAKLKIIQIEKDVADAKQEIDKVTELIIDRKADAGRTIFLI
jgi:hypothetical protein